VVKGTQFAGGDAEECGCHGVMFYWIVMMVMTVIRAVFENPFFSS